MTGGGAARGIGSVGFEIGGGWDFRLGLEWWRGGFPYYSLRPKI